MASKILSCGVLIMNSEKQLLLCHSTGNSWWDIPKGHCDEGEQPLVAALRETKEETAIELEPAVLLDLGQISYKSTKNLHLFATLLPTTFDPVSCRCDSFFAHYRTGKPTPEVDGFAWVPFTEVPNHCAKNMTRVLTNDLRLEGILNSLLSR